MLTVLAVPTFSSTKVPVAPVVTKETSSRPMTPTNVGEPMVSVAVVSPLYTLLVGVRPAAETVSGALVIETVGEDAMGKVPFPPGTSVSVRKVYGEPEKPGAVTPE